MSTCAAASRQTSLLGEAFTYFLTRHFSRVWGGVNRLESGVLAGTYSPISPQDAIDRRFNRVLARFTIWSILIELGTALGMGLLDIGPLGLN